jgi:hypothetical protein
MPVARLSSAYEIRAFCCNSRMIARSVSVTARAMATFHIPSHARPDRIETAR